MQIFTAVFERVFQSKTKIVVFTLLLVLYASLLAHEIKLPAADDLGGHIKNGELLIQGHFDVLNKNVYSYTEPDQPFANHHWLFGVVIYLVHQVAGFEGDVIFKTGVLLTAFALLFCAALKRSNFWIVAVFSIPTILILAERTDVRPEMFSYLFIALYLFLLLRFSEKSDNLIFLLIPLQVAWVNTHIFFSIGIMLVVGFLVERIVFHFREWRTDPGIRKLGLVVCGLILASCINPHGISGALYGYQLHIFGDIAIGITENQSVREFLQETYYWENLSIATMIPMAMVLALSFVVGWRNFQIFYFLASIGATTVAFMMLRGLPLFAYMFLPAVSANLAPMFERLYSLFLRHYPRMAHRVGSAVSILIIGTIATLIFFALQGDLMQYKRPGIGLVPYAEDAAIFFREHRIRGPIFNDADLGGYLMYELYPGEKLFVDNRFGDAYSEEFFNNIYLPMIADERAWTEYSERYGINAIFFYQYDGAPGARGFLQRRMADPAWALVYADPYNLIFVRNLDEYAELIRTFHITPINAPDRLRPLLQSSHVLDQLAAPDIFNLLGRRDLAENAFKNILMQYPDQGRSWSVLAQMELLKKQTESPSVALRYLENALSAGYTTAEVYAFIGLAQYKQGHFPEAIAALEKALDINPEREDARALLETIHTEIREGIR